MSFLLDHFSTYLAGARTTAFLTLGSFACAFLLGVLIAAFRVSPVPPLRAAGVFWVETVRNTPLTVLFVIFYFGFTKVGIKYSALASALIVLSAYTSTFVAETVRSGINSVSAGQGEAARAIGLTFPQALALVVLPQALRTVVAPLGSVFIALIKNSSIAAVIAVHELTETANVINNQTAQPLQAYAGAAIVYLVLALSAARAVRWLELRLAIRR